MLKNKKIYIIFILCLIIFGLSLLLFSVQAATPLNLKSSTTFYKETAGKAALPTAGIVPLIGAIIKASLTLIGAAFVIIFIYGGFMWMSAAGNQDKIVKARKMIVAAIIGLAIVISAYSITYFLTLAIESPTSPTSTTTQTPTK